MFLMISRRHLLASAVLNLVWILPVSAADLFTSGIENGLIQGNAVQTQHFQFEFSDVVGEQADSDGDGIPNLIEVTAEAAEESWDIVIDDLGYEEPTGDGSRLIVIMDDNDEYLSSSALGITSLLSNGNPYVAIDPWMSDAYLQVTMGHEFFHAVQFGYDPGFAYSYQGINFAEATATWVEDLIFDSVDDYALYIPEFLSYIDYSIFASIVPTGTLYEYGMNIWPRFLSEYYDNNVIKNVWETYFDSSIDFDSDLKLYEAVKDVVGEEGGDLEAVFQQFTLWNLNLDSYEEGDIYPEVFILEGEESQDYVLSDESYAPALFGSNYLYFENSSGSGEFSFHLVKPEGVSFAVSLVPYDGVNYDTDAAETVIIGKDDEMSEALSLSHVGAQDGVMAVISALNIDYDDGNNWEVFDEGYLYYYLADYGLNESEFEELMSGTEEELTEEIEETDGEKEGETTEYASDGRGQSSLTLSVVSFDQNSATFSWNRLDDNDIAGYELHYGTSSGSHANKLEIKTAYTTFSTVADLEAGETYYFTLRAVDKNDDKVGEESSEVSLTPEEWLFEDISFANPHYAAIENLVEMGIFEGYADNTFRPETEINRAELLKILVEGRDIEVDASLNKNCFPDVGEEWYSQYVCYAKYRGWIKGYSDGTFRPSDTVNKVEALKMLFNVYEMELSEDATVANLKYTDLDENAWYAIYVWKASSLGILEETVGGTFNGADGRNRGDMAEELYRYLVVEEGLKE
ncbi:MAG: S-layer homology domain-containing protein [Patescibacteria group bacterium]